MTRPTLLIGRGLLLTLAIVGSGCVGTETGNPEIIGSKVSLLVASSEPARISTSEGDDPADLLVDTASLSVAAIRFITCDGVEVAFDENSFGAPQGGQVMLPEGRYCSLEVALTTQDVLVARFELEGSRIEDSVPFNVDVEHEGTIALNQSGTPPQVGSAGFDADSAQDYLLVLDLARLLPSDLIQSTAVNSAGDASVNFEMSPNLASEVAANLNHSFVLSLDQDGGGRAEPAELLNPVLRSP